MLHAYSIISVSNWEVADVVVGSDNGGQAVDTEAQTQIFGTHDSLIECTTCTGHSRAINAMLVGRRQREFAETTKGCTQYDGWLNFTLHGWAYTLSSHSPHPTVPQLHRVIIIIRCYCCFVRGNVSIETKWSKWLIWTNVRTEFSRVFFSFFTCKFMEFWFFQFSLWNNSRSLLYSQHSNCADCKWLTRQEKWRKKTI